MYLPYPSHPQGWYEEGVNNSYRARHRVMSAAETSFTQRTIAQLAQSSRRYRQKTPIDLTLVTLVVHSVPHTRILYYICPCHGQLQKKCLHNLVLVTGSCSNQIRRGGEAAEQTER